MPKLAPLLTALVIGLGASSAQAHKLKVFATAVGNDVSGFAYFAPGGRAQDCAVTVTLPDGAVVERMRTSQTGDFHFTARQRADYSIAVDAGDGHEASYRVPASELAMAEPGQSTAEATAQESVAPALPAGPGANVPEARIASLVDEAVARQLRPLREEINAWQEKIWFHDILGGLGAIFGLGGLLYGLSGSRRSREREEDSRRLREARR